MQKSFAPPRLGGLTLILIMAVLIYWKGMRAVVFLLVVGALELLWIAWRLRQRPSKSRTKP